MNFSEILIKIQDFSLMKMHLKMSSAKWWPFCPGGDELPLATNLKIGMCTCHLLLLDLQMITSIAWWKTALTPLLTHWSYYSLAPSHRHNLCHWQR